MVGSLVALALVLGGCRSREAAPPAFETLFERVETLHVAPIDPFGRIPTSLAVLPDGRLVIPETEGVWLHLVKPDGMGITRIGGETLVKPESTSSTPQAAGTPRGLTRFTSISSVSATPDGRLLVAERGSNVVAVFGQDLEPDGALTVPGARSVWRIDPLPGGRFAAAVEPDRATSGQITLLGLEDSARSVLPQDPFLLHNRWEAVASTRMEVLPDGRILAYWAPLPWAILLSASGDSLGVMGRLSARYHSPSSGPRRRAPLEALRRWYESFTPLVGIEAVGGVIVFEFLAAEGAFGARPAVPRRARRPTSGERSAQEGTTPANAANERETPAANAARSAPPAAGGTRQAFVNVYDERGRTLATDLLLPPGSRILASNDSSRLFLLTKASPRELEIEVWRPDLKRLSRLGRT